MTAEIVEVEGEVRDLTVVEQQPGQAIVASSADPAGMVAIASKLATVLSDIVERQRLYATIRGKKYPQVEAWMTIGRLDNVVAREPKPPVRHDDGSYEAFAELIRLSDGMVVGSSSALCGTKDDAPWNERSEPARRSMAQTRATSRAFRQQYSWVMSLAGYEATPAEEMPHDAPRSAAPVDDGYRGTIEIGTKPDGTTKQGQDFELRQTPGGHVLGFRLGMGPRKGMAVVARDTLAVTLAGAKDTLLGREAICYGTVEARSFDKTNPDGTTRKIPYNVLHLDRLVPAGDTAPTSPDAAGGAVTQPTAKPLAAIDPEIDGLAF